MRHWPFLLICLVSLHCTGNQERETAGPSDPRIHWDDIYRVFEIPLADEGRLRSIPGLEALPPVAETQRGPVYRVPIEQAAAVEKLGYRPLRDLPFRYIDPDIERRRASGEPARWFAGYKDVETVDRILTWFERQRPAFCKRYEIGRSVRGKPIWALRISVHPDRDEAEPSLLFDGAHHGNELLSIDYVLDMASQLLGLPGLSVVPGPDAAEAANVGRPFTPAEREQILARLEIWIVPIVNPDGVDEYWNRSIQAGRKNARGVDLNRNYPFLWNSGTVGASGGSAGTHDYRGPLAASEPETRAMMDFATRQRFSLSFSYHTFATRILFPYTIDGAMNPWPDRTYFYAKELAAAGISFRPSKRYEAARKLYPVDGTDQDWLFHTFGTAAFIVEGSMDTPDYAMGRKSILGMRPVWQTGIRHMLLGPRIEIQVLDTSGRPLPGSVVRTLEEVRLEGEEWTVHPRSARFDLLPGPKEDWTIEISHPGYRSVQKKISCRNVCKEKFYLTRQNCPQESLHAEGSCR